MCKKCSCGNEQCPRVHDALTAYTAETDSSDEEMERYVSDEDKKLINEKLMSYKFTLTSSAAGVIIDSDVLHGFTNEIVVQIVQRCNSIFTPEDVMSKFPIWSFNTAVEICNIICDVLGDTNMYNLLEDTEEDSDYS